VFWFLCKKWKGEHMKLCLLSEGSSLLLSSTECNSSRHLLEFLCVKQKNQMLQSLIPLPPPPPIFAGQWIKKKQNSALFFSRLMLVTWTVWIVTGFCISGGGSYDLCYQKLFHEISSVAFSQLLYCLNVVKISYIKCFVIFITQIRHSWFRS